MQPLRNSGDTVPNFNPIAPPAHVPPGGTTVPAAAGAATVAKQAAVAQPIFQAQTPPAAAHSTAGQKRGHPIDEGQRGEISQTSDITHENTAKVEEKRVKRDDVCILPATSGGVKHSVEVRGTVVAVRRVVLSPAPAAAPKVVQNTPEDLQQLTGKVADVIRALWKQEPTQGQAFATYQVYKNNAEVPALLGKAIVLEKHYYAGRARAAANPASNEVAKPKADEDVKPTADEAGLMVFAGSLSAARRISEAQCYCPNHACETNLNCKSFKELFGYNETAIEPLMESIMRATYGTSDIARVREFYETIKKHLNR